ncbi:hypothetical protein F503_00008 [Ophiostoma piceae UAMH 11346]|uniref:Uncharacterized protein n=1 Tax=Ophiostoma piceae (strain UAMH 11346) TaxID=1262450 RepID=S3BUB3_OPHP1|nr:hypothetical protein F503_00008 [Ophiostoma piceae UAMH 11346]
MKRATFFKSSGGSISLSSSPSADQSSKDKAKDRETIKAGGRQSIRGRISAPIPFLDSLAPTGSAPTPMPMPTAAADLSVPISLPISVPIAVVSPVASPVTETAPAKLEATVDAGPHHADDIEAYTQAEPDEAAHADDADISATQDNAYDADLEDAGKGKALDETEEKKDEIDGRDEDDGADEEDGKDDYEKDEVVEMAHSPELMPPLHSQKQRLAAISPAGHRRVQTLDAPKQQPATTLRPPHLSQPPPPRQQAQQTQQTQQTQSTSGSPFRHRTNPSSTLRYSTASGASGTASIGGGTGGTATSGENTANSSPKPHRKKSTLRGALSKLFGRKKMGMSMHGHSQSQNPHGYQKTDSYMPTIDDHYGDYEKELERGPNHRSVRSDPTILSMARGESKRSASLPISEFDRALRSHSVGPEEVVAIESARNSLTADRVASITNMSNFSNLSNLSHVASLDGGRRRAATTTRVSLYPSQSLSQPLQARRRFGNNSAEVLGGSEWTGLSPRPASAHGRGISRLSSHSHSNGHGLSASTSHATPGPAADLAISTSHVSHLSSTSMSARHDPSEIGRAITSDGPGLDVDTLAQRRRSRSLSGLAEIALGSVQARRRSDEIRYWRESYDPAYQSPLSSRHGDDEDDMDDDDEYDGEGEDIHDEYTRPDYEGDDESEEDSDVDADVDDGNSNSNNKANAFQQRNSLSNVIHASKLQRILQTQAQAQAQAERENQTQTAEKALQPAPGKSAQEFPFPATTTVVSTRIPRPVSSHSVKAITNLSANAASSMNAGSSSSAHAASATDKTDRTDSRLGGLETRMNRMESVVDQLCHSVPGFKSPSQSQSQSQSQTQPGSAFAFDVPRSAPAPTSSPYAYVTNQPAIPPIPAIYQSQVAQVQSQTLSQSQSPYSMSRRSFDLDQERDGDQDDEIDDGHSHMSFGDGQTYIGSIPPSSSATQAPSMLATSGPFYSHNQTQNHHLVHHESTASLQTANLMAQLESERAVRQTLETQVKKLNERVNMLSTTMYAMLRDPAAAAAASKSVKSTTSPQSPRRSPSSASVAASIAAAQLKADTVIQTAKALGHGTPRDTTNSHTFSVESGGITPKGFIHDTSPSEFYYSNGNETENNENEDPIHDSDSKRRKAARTLSLGQLTLGKSAVQP